MHRRKYALEMLVAPPGAIVAKVAAMSCMRHLAGKASLPGDNGGKKPANMSASRACRVAAAKEIMAINAPARGVKPGNRRRRLAV